MKSVLLSYSEALQRIHEHIRLLPSERISWREALGLTLAEDITARESAPAFDNSAVDGYALRAEDVASASPQSPASLRRVGNLFAGASPAAAAVEPNTAVKTSTGAPIPYGANAVVMIEHVHEEADRILVHTSIPLGGNIRRRAEEIRTGETLIQAGSRIGPVEWGLLISQGIMELSVRRLPTVALLATGDELIEPAPDCPPGKIRNVNAYTLEAELRSFGCEVISLGIAADTPEAIRNRLQAGLEQSDFLLTTGGVSMGEKDYLPSLLRDIGVEIVFHGVAMKPGKPLLFGTHPQATVFSLPGNVVSVLASYHLFVKPALRLASGRHDWRTPSWYARSGVSLSNSSGRTNFIRARLSQSPTGMPIAFPAGGQGSSMLTSMRGADGFLVVPADVEIVEEFAEVEFIPI